MSQNPNAVDLYCRINQVPSLNTVVYSMQADLHARADILRYTAVGKEPSCQSNAPS
jgi:hypothetical protein